MIAVALVALGLDPLRRRLQRSVDRLLYGDRNDPYAVATAVGRALGSFSDAPATLTDAAQAVARSLALPYVAIEILGERRRTAERALNGAAVTASRSACRSSTAGSKSGDCSQRPELFTASSRAATVSCWKRSRTRSH